MIIVQGVLCVVVLKASLASTHQRLVGENQKCLSLDKANDSALEELAIQKH